MLSGEYNYSTRSVAMPFVYDGYAFTMHVQFAKGKVHIHCVVKVSGKVCLKGVMSPDYSGKEMAV